MALTLPLLTDIRFNLFTDSIKPVLNYYVNVEGTFSSGKVYPLDTSFVTITASEGSMQGMEWIKPASIDFEKVIFTAVSKFNPEITATTTVYIKRRWGPRNEVGKE